MRFLAPLADPLRRNVAILALAQALFMSVQGMGIAATPLAAYGLLPADQKWLATVPIFLVHLGIMGTTIPASLLMGVIGRRAGFSLGALFGVVSGIMACAAMYIGSFPWLCAAAAFQGMQAAFFWYFRLAAADATEPTFRAKAISLVMAGGVLAGLPRPAGGEVVRRLAGAGHFRGRLSGHGGVFRRGPGPRAAGAHPAAGRRGAGHARPADARDLAAAELSRRAWPLPYAVMPS